MLSFGIVMPSSIVFYSSFVPFIGFGNICSFFGRHEKRACRRRKVRTKKTQWKFMQRKMGSAFASAMDCVQFCVACIIMNVSFDFDEIRFRWRSSQERKFRVQTFQIASFVLFAMSMIIIKEKKVGIARTDAFACTSRVLQDRQSEIQPNRICELRSEKKSHYTILIGWKNFVSILFCFSHFSQPAFSLRCRCLFHPKEKSWSESCFSSFFCFLYCVCFRVRLNA